VAFCNNKGPGLRYAGSGVPSLYIPACIGRSHVSLRSAYDSRATAGGHGGGGAYIR
jgi:hypothetical protein